MRSLLVVGIVLLAALGIALWRSDTWEKLEALRADLARIEAQNDDLRRQNRLLAREAELLARDGAALEQVARHEYGLVGEDEWVIRLGPTGSAKGAR